MVLELFSLAALPTRYAGEKEMRLYLLSRTDTWMLKTVNLLVMLWTCLDYDLLKLKGLCWFGSSEYQCYKHKFVPTWLWGLVLKASCDERQLLLEFQKLQQAEASVGPLRIPRLLVSYTFSISFLCQASQRSSLASRSIRIYFRGSTWPWLKLIEPRKLDGLIPKMAIVPQIEPETYWDILGWKNIHPSTFSMIESCSQLRLLSSRLHSEEGLSAFAQEFVLCSRYLEVCLGVKSRKSCWGIARDLRLPGISKSHVEQYHSKIFGQWNIRHEDCVQ